MLFHGFALDTTKEGPVSLIETEILNTSAWARRWSSARRGWREISAKRANLRQVRAAPEKIGVCAQGSKSPL
jgi:hypothetical protein